MEGLAMLARALLNNLLGYDLILFCMAAVTLVCYYLARHHADKTNKILNPTESKSTGLLKAAKTEAVIQSEGEIEKTEALLKDMRNKLNLFYSIFASLTGMFTLAGMLGTVVSLIPMVSDLESMQHGFFTALTSTFWGIVFSIIFKFLDSFLSVRVEENMKDIELYFDRATARGGEKS